MVDYEKEGYICYPTPLEFNSPENEGNILPQPEVTKVEWQCELEYEDYKYIESDSLEKDALVSDGYSCESVACDKDGNDDSILLCTK